jgi:hypothetical protein
MYVKQKIVEKQRTEQEIQILGAILKERNVDIQTIREFKKLEGELEKYGLSVESPRKLVSILSKINQMGYDPLKIRQRTGATKIAQYLQNKCQKINSQYALSVYYLGLCSFQIEQYALLRKRS